MRCLFVSSVFVLRRVSVNFVARVTFHLKEWVGGPSLNSRKPNTHPNLSHPVSSHGLSDLCFLIKPFVLVLSSNQTKPVVASPLRVKKRAAALSGSPRRFEFS